MDLEEIVESIPSVFHSQQVLSNYKQAVLSLQATLIKSKQNRHQNDQNCIQNFIQLSPLFQSISLSFSPEFAKDIIKSGKVHCIKGKKCIYQKGQQLMRIFIPLIGSFYKKIQERNDIQDEEESSLQQKLELLIKDAHTNISLKKKTTSMERKVSNLLENNDVRTFGANFENLGKLRMLADEQPPCVDGLESETCASSLYIKGQTWIFSITPQAFRKCIVEEYEHRLLTKSNCFRKLRCFDILDDDQLKVFVENIPLIQLKKDDFVFREGHPSHHLYLLVEGEAKATHTVQLFKEDPNALYRTPNIFSKRQSGRRVEKMPQFSYVDFEGVFNYSPRQKRMQLGILAPVTIFGEEEVAAGLPREADVQITSTKAKMFVFTLKDLEEAGCGKKVGVDQFMNQLYDSITCKRITSRRESLSNSLVLENRRSMDYFFLENKQVQPQNRLRTAKERINRSLSPAVHERQHSSVKPRYDNFNFNEFITLPKKSNLNLSKLYGQEAKVARLTHNSTDIQDMIEVSARMSAQKKSYQHKINIATPLFDSNYYKKQRKEILRIQNKKRMRLIEVTGLSKSKNRTTSALG